MALPVRVLHTESLSFFDVLLALSVALLRSRPHADNLSWGALVCKVHRARLRAYTLEFSNMRGLAGGQKCRDFLVEAPRRDRSYIFPVVDGNAVLFVVGLHRAFPRGVQRGATR